MKKLLSLLAAIVLTGSSAGSVVSCTTTDLATTDNQTKSNTNTNNSDNDNSNVGWGNNGGSSSKGSSNNTNSDKNTNGSSHKTDNSTSDDSTSVNPLNDMTSISSAIMGFVKKLSLQDQYGFNSQYLDNEIFNKDKTSDDETINQLVNKFVDTNNAKNLNTLSTDKQYYGKEDKDGNKDPYPLLSVLGPDASDTFKTIMGYLEGVNAPSPTEFATTISMTMSFMNLFSSKISPFKDKATSTVNKILSPTMKIVLDDVLSDQTNLSQSKYSDLNVGNSLDVIVQDVAYAMAVAAGHFAGNHYGYDDDASKFQDLSSINKTDGNPNGQTNLQMAIAYISKVITDSIQNTSDRKTYSVENISEYLMGQDFVPKKDNIKTFSQNMFDGVQFLAFYINQFSYNKIPSNEMTADHIFSKDKTNFQYVTDVRKEVIKNVPNSDFNPLGFISNIVYYLGDLGEENEPYKIQGLFAMMFMDDDKGKNPDEKFVLNWDNSGKVIGWGGSFSNNNDISKESSNMTSFSTLVNSVIRTVATTLKPDPISIPFVGSINIADLAVHNVYLLLQSMVWNKGFALSTGSGLGIGMQNALSLAGLQDDNMPNVVKMKNEGLLNYLYKDDLNLIFDDIKNNVDTIQSILDMFVKNAPQLKSMISGIQQKIQIIGEQKPNIVKIKDGTPEVHNRESTISLSSPIDTTDGFNHSITVQTGKEKIVSSLGALPTIDKDLTSAVTQSDLAGQTINPKNQVNYKNPRNAYKVGDTVKRAGQWSSLSSPDDAANSGSAKSGAYVPTLSNATYSIDENGKAVITLDATNFTGSGSEGKNSKAWDNSENKINSINVSINGNEVGNNFKFNSDFSKVIVQLDTNQDIDLNDLSISASLGWAYDHETQFAQTVTTGVWIWKETWDWYVNNGNAVYAPIDVNLGKVKTGSDINAINNSASVRVTNNGSSIVVASDMFKNNTDSLDNIKIYKDDEDITNTVTGYTPIYIKGTPDEYGQDPKNPYINTLFLSDVLKKHLGNLLSIFGVGYFDKGKNPLDPSFGSFFTNMDIAHLVRKAGSYFNIDGSETPNTISKMGNVDYKKLKVFADSLFNEDGTKNIVDEFFDNLNNPGQLKNIFGIQGTNAYDPNKFLGALLNLFSKDLDIDNGTIHGNKNADSTVWFKAIDDIKSIWTDLNKNTDYDSSLKTIYDGGQYEVSSQLINNGTYKDGDDINEVVEVIKYSYKWYNPKTMDYVTKTATYNIVLTRKTINDKFSIVTTKTGDTITPDPNADKKEN